jgi:hypothetical protein
MISDQAEQIYCPKFYNNGKKSLLLEEQNFGLRGTKF